MKLDLSIANNKGQFYRLIKGFLHRVKFRFELVRPTAPQIPNSFKFSHFSLEHYCKRPVLLDLSAADRANSLATTALSH